MIKKIEQALKKIDGTIFLVILALGNMVLSFLANMSIAISPDLQIPIFLLGVCLFTVVVYYRANRFEGIKKHFWIPYPIANFLMNFLFPMKTHNTEYSGIMFIHLIFLCILSFSNAKKKIQ